MSSFISHCCVSSNEKELLPFYYFYEISYYFFLAMILFLRLAYVNELYTYSNVSIVIYYGILPSSNSVALEGN